jgi:hypothetical protein
MAKISLPCFIELEITARGIVRPVHGVRSVLSQGTEEGLIVELGDVPMNRRVKAPEGALTTLYGFTHSTQELPARREEATKNKNLFSMIDLTAEVGRVKLGAIGPKDLPKVRFLVIDKIALESRQKFLDAVNDALEKAGRSTRIDDVRDVGTVPETLAYVLRQPAYRHLSVVVYSTESEYGLRQLASSFNYDDLIPDVRKREVIDRFMAIRLVEYLVEEGRPAVPPEDVHFQKVTPEMFRRLERDPAFVNFGMKFYWNTKGKEPRIVHDWDGLWKGRKCARLRGTPNVRITVVIPEIGRKSR